ncbi:MAG: DUF454 domain-containing protein [Fretibacterium sp.]|nr:DUF454 domain-containing protein [Fretibacterium sp.]
MNLWFLLGAFFLLLAIVGTALPIMPTVPFVLLAAGCFARSSRKWHRWLRQNPKFGPAVRDWEEHRCISRRTKFWGVTMTLLGGGSSTCLFIPRGWMKWTAMGIFVVASLIVLCWKECPPRDSS